VNPEIGTASGPFVSASLSEPGAEGTRPEVLLSRLGTDVMLVVAGLGGGSAPEVELLVGGDLVEAESRALDLSVEESGDEAASVLTIWVPTPVSGQTVELAVRAGDEEVRLGPGLALAVGVDLRTTIREQLAGREADERQRILDFLAATLAEHPQTLDPLGVAKSLFALREALRDPYPQAELSPDQSQGLHIGAVAKIDERTFFARGWARDDQAPIVRLDAISPEGGRAELVERLFRVPRPDLDELFRGAPRPVPKPGFVCFFELENPSRLAEGWIFELENAAGVGIEANAAAATVDPLAVRDTILGELVRERRVDTPLMNRLVPAVVRLQEELASRVQVDEVDDFGVIPEEAEVSVVVPLYRRVDLIEHQLAQFANDPGMLEAELIYVLDSPELATELLPRVAELHDLYRVPFRLATLSRNGGFAVAANRGASLASGRLLLQMDSDVLPARPGWLAELGAAFDELPEAGAVAPKLLYDDGSIQHAGLEFRSNPASGGLELAHAYKGLHGGFAAANERRAVPALSGACLLLERELYEELGGFSADYVKGGYEDADLCLRIQGHGQGTWYVPEVELYHLEGRSYVPSATDMSNRFNAWLFDQRWGGQLRQGQSGEGT
jgi:GT2 family glycosyltransferase